MYFTLRGGLVSKSLLPYAGIKRLPTKMITFLDNAIHKLFNVNAHDKLRHTGYPASCYCFLRPLFTQVT